MRMGSTNVLEPSAVTCSVGGKVLPGLCEAEPAVGTAAALVGVMVILAVVFPEADGADLVVTPLFKRQVTTARTCVRLASRRPTHVDEHARDCCF